MIVRRSFAFCLILILFITNAYSQDTSATGKPAPAVSPPARTDTLTLPSERIRGKTIDSSHRDSLRGYIIISDTIFTAPLSKDTLSKVDLNHLKPAHITGRSKMIHEKLATPYKLFKPKYWSKSIDGSLNLTEATFSQNWKSGGLNSLAALATVNARTDYERYDVSFTNDLQSQYGAANQRTLGLRKTADRLYLDSKFAIKVKKPFYIFTAVNFQSQFGPGYTYATDSLGHVLATKISGFLAPGYLTESLGLEYKPNTYFSLRFGVGSFRQTFVTDLHIYKNTQNNYGVPVGEKAMTEAAFQLVANFDKDLSKNLHLKTLFQFFESYTNSANTSSRLDLTLTAKVNKMLNVNFMGTALYDRNQDSHIQFTQFLSLGIAYKYSDFK